MEANIQSTQDIIDKYYRGGKKDGRPKTASIKTLSTDDIIDEYYRGGRRDRQRPRPASTSIIPLAVDNNNAVFSFNFGLTLLDSFIKINFDTFGVLLLDQFINA